MNEKKCDSFNDPDCCKCSFYEPKAAYPFGPKVSCLLIVACVLAFLQFTFPYLLNFSGGG